MLVSKLVKNAPIEEGITFKRSYICNLIIDKTNELFEKGTKTVP